MPDRFELLLYRILGNDLPPRHDSRQTLGNLRFILEHESLPANVERRWLLNRITDEVMAQEITLLIEAKGEKHLRIPFDRAEYALCFIDASGLPGRFDPLALLRASDPAPENVLPLEWLYRYKNLYAINLNAARNLAIEEGRKKARWTLAFDGNTFLTASGFAQLQALVGANPEVKYLVVPLARLSNNGDLLDPAFAPQAFDEPQIAFRDDARDRFDEKLRYGNMNKVELLCRLGVPGPWNTWRRTPWEPRHRMVALDRGSFATGAWVARLNAGAQRGVERAHVSRWSARIQGVVLHCAKLDQSLLDKAKLAKSSNCYGEQLDVSGSTRDAIVASANKIFSLQPLSVAMKQMVVPGIGKNDYFSVAPHFHPTPGGKFVHIDGVRSAAADDLDSDRNRFQIFVQRTVILAAAYKVTGEKRYSQKAAEAVRLWFLDDAHHMRPHARFAQLIPDRRGEPNFTAIVEFRHIWPLLDAFRILAAANDLSTDDLAKLRGWFTAFRNDWTASKAGDSASVAKNNIATYHDLVVAAISAFIGDMATFASVIDHVPARLHLQVQAYGAQPAELARQRPLHYSLFNLQAWVGLAGLGRSAGIDLWRAAGRDCRSIPWAIRFAYQNRKLLADYAEAPARFDQRLTLLLRSVPADAGDHHAVHDLRPLSENFGRINLDDGVPPLWAVSAAKRVVLSKRGKGMHELHIA